jgi:Tol biopolymer transport system component/DNA-binding winged helix-turn-helix (wHTH) protein
MADIDTRLRPLRFEDFELDMRAGELRKNGVKLKLTGQPLLVLAALLERPGDVVTRDELQKRLWPDTFVDVDHNLNTAINKIREALADSSENPRYVETVPRRGYRFIAKLQVPERATAAVELNRVLPVRRRWLKIGAGIFAILILSIGTVIWFRLFRAAMPTEKETEKANLTPLPFTALPGQATSPAFAPDGSRIAFAWNGDPASAGKGFDLYVKASGSETMLRLTQEPSEWISPAWSPDGTQIAFHRVAGADTGIYVVPALGGPERKLRSTRMPGTDFNFSLISWSPDGKWIAFADVVPEDKHERVYLLSTETLDVRQSPISPTCIGEGLPAFSHNGEYLAYWCLRGGYDAVLFSLPVSGGQPKTISSFRAFPNGLTWSADDEKLIYSLHPLGMGPLHELGEVTVESGLRKRLAFAGSAILPTVSAKGNKLAYSSLFASSEIWRRDLLQPKPSAVLLIPSSRSQFDAQYSPDGRRIAFASLRSGLQGVWISSDDGNNLVQISNPNYVSGSPQWSPDGNRIAFDSFSGEKWEIYISEIAERKPRKLITNIPNVTRPRWSRDGKWIYFRAGEPGRVGVYRCPASGGDPIALAKDSDAINPRESLDGKTIYFASNYEGSTLKQVALPAQPDTESEVHGLPRLSDADSWTLSPNGIYFVPAAAPKSLRYFDFATRQIREIFEVDRDFSGNLSVSPDGRWILYSQVGETSGDIMLIDHFQ